MAQYKIGDPDDLVQCPFNPEHMVRSKRMPYHLIKCKKNYPDKQYAVCPFNAYHYVKKEDLQEHIATCEFASVIENDLIYNQRKDDDSFFHGDCSVPDYTTPVMDNVSGEDWDAECDDTRGVFKIFQISADEYFGIRNDSRPEPVPTRLPNSIPKALQAQTNKSQGLPLNQVKMLGRGRGFSTQHSQPTHRPGLQNKEEKLIGDNNNRQSAFSKNSYNPNYDVPQPPSAVDHDCEGVWNNSGDLCDSRCTSSSFYADVDSSLSVLCSSSLSLQSERPESVQKASGSKTMQSVPPPPGFGRGTPIVPRVYKQNDTLSESTHRTKQTSSPVGNSKGRRK